MKKKWKERFKDPAFVAIGVSILALIVSGFTFVANWWEAYGTNTQVRISLAESYRRAERRAIEDWQALVVFSIIEKGFAENNYESGVSFDAIKGQYLDEAKTVKVVVLDEDDIQPWTLKKVLMSLIRDGMVYQTGDGKYVVSRSELLPGFGRFGRQERAGYEILYILATESGKYDDQKLQVRIIDKFQLTPREYRYLITEMISAKYVVRGEDGILYSASKPPEGD